MLHTKSFNVVFDILPACCKGTYYQSNLASEIALLSFDKRVCISSSSGIRFFSPVPGEEMRMSSPRRLPSCRGGMHHSCTLKLKQQAVISVLDLHPYITMTDLVLDFAFA